MKTHKTAQTKRSKKRQASQQTLAIPFSTLVNECV